MIVKDRHFVEIGLCGECGNEILGLVYEPFTILACGHIYHRKCIKKNFLSNICPTSDCNKSVDPVATERRFSQSSQSSTSSIVRRMSNQLQLNSPVIREEDEEMRDVEVKGEPRNCSKCSEVISLEILEPVILLHVTMLCISNVLTISISYVPNAHLLTIWKKKDIISRLLF